MATEEIETTTARASMDAEQQAWIPLEPSAIPEEPNPIPNELERPRYVVLDEQHTTSDGTKYRAGVWWFGLKPSKGDALPALVQSWICSPLHVDAVTFDAAGANFGRLLRFRNTLGQWKTWAMPMEMLRGDTADLRGVLLSMGVHLDPSNAGRHMLATYLQSQVPTRKMEAVMQTGWAGGQFKAFALQAAASVWGGDNFRRSWRTTANGLEGAAALFNDSLLALDEISECDPRDVGEVVYMLGNGRGKQRASRNGSARTVHRWRTSVISTGERSIATSMAEAGQRVKAGQAVRLLDITAQRTFGAWDNLHQHQNGPAFSDALKRAANANYGTAGRAFLEKLTRDTGDMATRLEDIKAHLLTGVQSGDGQPSRAAARLAVLALAGELATTYGITGWDEGEATTAAKVGFAAWTALRGDVAGNAEQDQVVQAVMAFVERHGDSRFSDATGPYDERIQAMVRDRAGWWASSGNGVEYFFTKDGMRDALKGFDFARPQGAAHGGPAGSTTHRRGVEVQAHPWPLCPCVRGTA